MMCVMTVKGGDTVCLEHSVGGMNVKADKGYPKSEKKQRKKKGGICEIRGDIIVNQSMACPLAR